MKVHHILALSCVALGLCRSLPAADSAEPAKSLADLVGRAAQVSFETHSAAEYAEAAQAYGDLQRELATLDGTDWDFDDEIDRDLLAAHLTTRLFEIEDLRLHELVPIRYLSLPRTDGLFLRPCGLPDRAVREAVEELERLPEVLDNGRAHLARPARTWTENAIYQASYARLLLEEYVPEACVDDPEVRDDLLRAARGAAQAVTDFEAWMRDELLPRSDRSPAWAPSEIETYQFVEEGLTEHGVGRMLEIARDEEARLTEEMTELAGRIHPSGDLRTVWELMKEEAPPWPEVLPMAQDYVDRATRWLEGPGAHIVEIPDFDYGARVTSPMARRVLSFGGAEYGPTTAGRISGYYVVTPLEEGLHAAERLNRLKGYNPYWTHVISYHEWLGHNVQRAFAERGPDRPMRGLFRSAYLSQAWSFYLERLLEEEGYYATLPHMEALKTAMARRQMRMWRVQRILTKLEMARGNMTFDEAVQAYVDRIGMEEANAHIEVQRDSQSPSPPGREIIGELVILQLRDEYARRMGEHFSLRRFHEALLVHGELPLPTVRRLMFRD